MRMVLRRTLLTVAVIGGLLGGVVGLPAIASRQAGARARITRRPPGLDTGQVDVGSTRGERLQLTDEATGRPRSASAATTA